MLKLLIPPFIIIFIRLLNKYFILFSRRNVKDKVYYLDGIKIYLPQEHNLDVFQKIHLKYDALIRIIAMKLPISSLFIDVGANIGDSAIPFLKRGIKTICIEPSDYFQNYLRKNLVTTGFDKDCVVINALVSTTRNSIKLNIYHGTASVSDEIGVIEKSENIVDCLTLDEICIERPEIDFIKIDTDGYDYDVLMSGIETLKSKKPLLLFECYVNKTNLLNYDNAFDMLSDVGYNNIYVFDNFGNLVLDTNNWNTVKSLNKYIVDTKSSRIKYLDIFCFGSDKSELGQSIILAFSNNFSNIQ